MIKTTKKINVTRKLIAFVIAIAVAFNFIPVSNNVKAYDDDGVIASYTYADGVTRNLEVRDGSIYIDDVVIVPVSDHIDEIGFDKCGQIWMIDKTTKFNITWGYYNPYTEEGYVAASTIEVDYGYVIWNFLCSEHSDISGTHYYTFGKASSLIFDEKGFVEGYKDDSGVIRKIVDLDENIRNRCGFTPYDFSTYLPERIVSTDPPVPTKDIMPTVVKNGNEYTYYRTLNGHYVYSSYTLGKNVLTYAGVKYKNVKYAGFIKKSGNVVYITKKGQAFVVTYKGKKKTLLKKNAKSLVKDSKGFVTKIKKKSGTLSVSNK